MSRHGVPAGAPRLAARTKDWLVRAPGAVERIEACFSELAYSPHRHDTYAIGITLGEVQSFDYLRDVAGFRRSQGVKRDRATR
jgi:hypothetical protein